MDTVAQGFFSLLRWRPDITRDEAKNVAVILVAPDEGVGRLRSVPVSSVSSRVREQGLLDSILVQLEARLAEEPKPGLDTLEELHKAIDRTLYVTEPRPVAVTTVDEAMRTLYRALLHKPTGQRAVTKGIVLDRVVTILRHRGFEVSRGAEVGDFLFDAVITSRGRPSSIFGVLSFAAARKDWTPILHDAGHFLYALERVRTPGKAVIQPPGPGPTDAASVHDRVVRWLDEAKVEHLLPEELEAAQHASLG